MLRLRTPYADSDASMGLTQIRDASRFDMDLLGGGESYIYTISGYQE